MRLEPVHQLVLEPLDRRTWRLCDHAPDRYDAECLIGLVEHTDHGEYEVTWVMLGGGCDRYPTLTAVMSAAIDLVGRADRPHGRPYPIPHIPPQGRTR